MRSKIETMTLKGFKTIQSLENFQPRPLTVLIGPNGAGKSNFISFFRMLSWMLADSDNIHLHVSQRGGAGTFLHEGATQTREMEAELTIRTRVGENQYAFRLASMAEDEFIFTDERYRFSRSDMPDAAPWRETTVPHRTPQLLADAASGNTTARVIRDILRKIVIYQFHNTSHTARMRAPWRLEDNRWLKKDTANIAPVLLRLKESNGDYYRRITDTIRLILPFFSDFVLEPDDEGLLLKWRERGSNQVFSVSQASGGMLRIVALVTLLLQPEQDLPDVLILDEPALELHPYAITIIGGLISAMSDSRQVIVATQSVSLLDCLAGPEDVVVVEREGRSSTFRWLDVGSLEEWLQDHSLSDLWEKNVIGGRP